MKRQMIADTHGRYIALSCGAVAEFIEAKDEAKWKNRYPFPSCPRPCPLLSWHEKRKEVPKPDGCSYQGRE